MKKAAKALIALALLGLPAAAEGRRFTVNDRTDHRPQRCTRSDCTLREAVIAANERQGRDAIVLLSSKRHELRIESTGEDEARDGDLDVTSGPLRIFHPGKGMATIDANRIDRVFDIGAARTRIEQLTIRGGSANPLDAGGDGGGITVGDIGDAPLTIVRSRIVDNRAPAVDGNGGGIDTDSTALVRIVESTISDNVAGGDGGGVTASLDGPLAIERSTLVDNTAGEGAGLMAVGPVTVVESTFARNRSIGGGDGERGDGAGIYVDDQGILDLTNSTIADNLAIGDGGGVFGEAGAIATVSSVTVARNRADADDDSTGTSGGIHLDAAAFEIRNSIIALNTATAAAPSDCGGGTFTGSAPNLVGTTAGGCGPGSEIVAADPLLGPLASNGGPTQTLAIDPASPAVGAADPALAPPQDQRGIDRLDGDPDLGAFEFLAY